MEHGFYICSYGVINCDRCRPLHIGRVLTEALREEIDLVCAWRESPLDFLLWLAERFPGELTPGKSPDLYWTAAEIIAAVNAGVPPVAAADVIAAVDADREMDSVMGALSALEGHASGPAHVPESMLEEMLGGAL